MSTPSPEMDLLLRLVGRIGSPARTPLDPRGLDANQLVESAIHHGLASHLYDALDPASLVRPRLRAPLALQRLRSLMATSALQEVAGLFREKGIDMLAFKGPSLAMTIHSDLGARPFTDIDVLVRPERLDEAVVLAGSLGFSGGELPPGAHRPKGKHVSLSREAGRLEVHDALFCDRSLMEFEGLWARSRPIALGRFTLRTLGAADTIFHASMHGTGHAFLSLKWLADLAGLARVFPEGAFREALEQADAAGHLPAFLCGWALLRELGAPLPRPIASALDTPDAARDRLVASCRRLWTPGRAGRRLGLVPHRLKMLSRRRQLQAVADLLFTPTESDWRMLPWVSPRVPVIFSVLRPVRIAFKLTRTPDDAQPPVYHFD